MTETRNKNKQAQRAPVTPTNFSSAADYQSWIDTQIREAMERGEFDNLKNQGKPLNLARDPNVPEEMEMAFHLLKNAGFAPDWIETRAQVQREREKLFAPLERFRANSPAAPAERARLQEKIITEFRARAAELNKLIDLYNLKAPTLQVHLHRIRIEDEIAKFLRE